MLANAHALADHRASLDARSRANRASSPITAQAPTVTPSPSSTLCANHRRRMNRSQAGSRASAAWPPAQTRAAADRASTTAIAELRAHSLPTHSGLQHHRRPRAPPSAFVADAASSAKTRSCARCRARQTIHAAQRSVSGLPCASLPPSFSISSPSVMRLSPKPASIEPRLARRPRLPAAMNPQPLVRIAPNPRFDRAGAALRALQNVGRRVLRARNLDLRARSAARSAARPAPTA